MFECLSRHIREKKNAILFFNNSVGLKMFVYYE